MIVASGFAFGPEYRRPDVAKGNIFLRATSQLSTHSYQLYETELAFPRLANDHAFVNFDARYRGYSRMTYYGPGLDSNKTVGAITVLRTPGQASASGSHRFA